jgi:hypothetical protein
MYNSQHLQYNMAKEKKYSTLQHTAPGNPTEPVPEKKKQ